MKIFLKTNLVYDFHIFKLNNLKTIHDLYIIPMFDLNLVLNVF
jgi:hypothetical protein